MEGETLEVEKLEGKRRGAMSRLIWKHVQDQLKKENNQTTKQETKEEIKVRQQFL